MVLGRALGANGGLEGGQAGGEAVVAVTFKASTRGDDELLGSFDDDAWGLAESLDKASIFVVGGGGEAAGLQVHAGSDAEVGAVHVVVRTVGEELLLVVEVERLAKFGAGGVAVKSDHAEHDVGAVAGQVQLVAQPGGFDLGVGVGAGQPYSGRVGVVADESLEACGPCDPDVAGIDGEAVDP